MARFALLLHSFAAMAVAVLGAGPALALASPQNPDLTGVVVRKNHPICIGLYIHYKKNCALNLPIMPGAPLVNYQLQQSMSEINKEMKQGGLGHDDRLDIMGQLRRNDPGKIYDWAKETKLGDKIKAALLTCAIGAVYGLLGGLLLLIIKQDLAPLVLAGTAFGGCVADLLAPSKKALLDAAKRTLRI
jgi:hypothetical protein